MIIYLLRIVIFPRYRGELLIADSQPNMGHELRAMLKQNELYIFRIGPCGPEKSRAAPVSSCLYVFCVLYILQVSMDFSEERSNRPRKNNDKWVRAKTMFTRKRIIQH